MKNILIIAFVTLSAVYVSGQKQQTLLSKLTADWCPRCGTWGWNYVKDVKKDARSENIIFMGVHFSGGLATPASKEFGSNLGSGYQPVFYLNNDDMNVSSSNVTAKVSEVLETAEALAGFPALTDIKLNSTLSGGGSLTVDGSVTFSENANSEYYLSVYLVRDNLSAYQASVGNNAIHPNILDLKLIGGTGFAQKMNSSPVSSNQKYEFTETVTNIVPHNSKIEDLKAIAIVWLLDSNGNYRYINGTEVTTKLQSSTDNAENLSFGYTVFQKEIKITSNEDISNATTQLVNINGIVIPTQLSINNANEANLTFQNINPGIYILSVFNGGKSGSQKLYIVE